MRIYRKGNGEKYTPFNHYEMTTQVIFNPDGGCTKANITLSTLKKRAGSSDEVHEHSDQVFYMIQGTMKVYTHGELKATLHEEDAILVLACKTHLVVNEEDLECIYHGITVLPLDKTQ
jgi:quercetin dioxygenase-like cupin family protein